MGRTRTSRNVFAVMAMMVIGSLAPAVAQAAVALAHGFVQKLIGVGQADSGAALTEVDDTNNTTLVRPRLWTKANAVTNCP
jgi:hypothetical protein